MSDIALNKLANKFWLNFWIVLSWFQEWAFYDTKTAIEFFTKNEDMIKAQPFVKWVWGKRQLISQLEKLFPKQYNNYFEPFVWAGAVFFNIQKQKSFLSDVNEELINTYRVIKTSPRKLIAQLKQWKYDKELFLKIRAWDREENWTKKYNKIQRAARFIFLNRTCFNGLYRVNSLGQFNVPFGAYTNPDFVQEKNILNSSKLLRKTKAEIRLQSFERVLDKAEVGDFIYFDPPYDTLTTSANFTSYDKSWFGQDMQVRLAEVYKELSDRGVKVMLSNHNTPLIREVYSWYKFNIVKARRNVNSKGNKRWEIEEIVVRNY